MKLFRLNNNILLLLQLLLLILPKRDQSLEKVLLLLCGIFEFNRMEKVGGKLRTFRTETVFAQEPYDSGNRPAASPTHPWIHIIKDYQSSRQNSSNKFVALPPVSALESSLLLYLLLMT